MAAFCVKCGTPFSEGQSFCKSCGARRSEPAASEPTKRFCTGCGAPLEGTSSFCTKCGTRAQPAGAVQPVQPLTVPQVFAASSQAAAVQTAPVQNADAPPEKKSGLLFKLVITALILFVFAGIAIGAGLIYVGYVAKKRVSAVQQAYKHDDVAGMIAAATGQENKPVPLPSWKAAPAELVSSPASKIPLRKSLRTINTGSDPLRGDYESIYIVNDVTDQSVHIKASQQFPNGDALDRLFGNKTNDKEKARTIKCGRTVFRADMETANETDGYFCRDGQDEKHPGTTAMSISRKEFNELKTTGETEVIFHEDPLRAVLKSFKNVMASGDDKASSDAASQDLLKKMMNLAPTGVMTPKDMDTPAVKYKVRRQGNSDLAFPVLVNDQPVELPVMDILCHRPDGEEGHIYVLDDADNPLFLAAAAQNLGREQVTKIYWDPDTPKNPLADELEKTGRAKVYDLYFDFRSHELRPESDKVLKEIADVMRQHPDWKLSIEGNTDNIGGDAYNLELSKRRAAAVKDALVADYNIAGDHLSTTGFGLSHPIDTNETIEGRARNRRVEIARQ